MRTHLLRTETHQLGLSDLDLGLPLRDLLIARSACGLKEHLLIVCEALSGQGKRGVPTGVKVRRERIRALGMCRPFIGKLTKLPLLQALDNIGMSRSKVKVTSVPARDTQGAPPERALTPSPSPTCCDWVLRLPGY